MTNLEQYFLPFRNNIVGIDQHIQTPYGDMPLVYADWIASGRLYRPIEDRISRDIGPYMANTHTETNLTGSLMTQAYHQAQQIIKKHVGANDQDVLVAAYSGMTGVVNKLQRMLGLRIHEKFHERLKLKPEERPVVFCTHMEHHSNQTSWIETICDLVIIRPDEQGRVDLRELESLLHQYRERPLKIAAVTSGSNVTGILTPYYDIAELMHRFGGYCFVDFACTAPYIDVNMHPANPLQQLDAIYFSPHKFLGGPGAPGGLTNYDSPSALGTSQVDGTPFGSLASVDVDDDGYVTAIFTNGLTRRIYQVPLATFGNVDGLIPEHGGVYRLGPGAGALSMRGAGVGGAGTIAARALEASTVDLAEEFSNLIMTQRAYSASSKIITTADEMLDELIRLKR